MIFNTRLAIFLAKFSPRLLLRVSLFAVSSPLQKRDIYTRNIISYMQFRLFQNVHEARSCFFFLKSAICISLMHSSARSNGYYLQLASQQIWILGGSKILRALTLNCSRALPREFGKFRDVTENCRASSFYLARLHYKYASERDERRDDPCDDCPRSMTVFKSSGTNTRKIVGDDATGWPCRLDEAHFQINWLNRRASHRTTPCCITEVEELWSNKRLATVVQMLIQ